jgi:hypothetical protein
VKSLFCNENPTTNWKGFRPFCERIAGDASKGETGHNIDAKLKGLGRATLSSKLREHFDHRPNTNRARPLMKNVRHFLERYHPVDVAFKVVGTGSVGTRDYVVLCFGNGSEDPLFLQVKEEPHSASAEYLMQANGLISLLAFVSASYDPLLFGHKKHGWRRWLIAVLAGIFLLQFYFVRELLAVELFFALGFAVVLAFGGPAYLIGSVGVSWLEQPRRSQSKATPPSGHSWSFDERRQI